MYRKGDGIYYTVDEVVLEGPIRLHIYDLDGTLIRTKSGRKFPIDDTDWEWLYPLSTLREAKEREEKVDENTYPDATIVSLLHTNQRGKGLNWTTFEPKLDQICTEMGISHCIVSTANETAKPSLRALRVWMAANGVAEIVGGFVVGDAAGRLNDHGITDYYYAYNLGFDFDVPENFFGGTAVGFPAADPYDEIDMHKYVAGNVGLMALNGQVKDYDVIMMVGPPASGKTTVAHALAAMQKEKRAPVFKAARTVLSADVMGTAAMLRGIKANVVIDACNGSERSRAQVLINAEHLGLSVCMIVLDVPIFVAKHMNHVRAESGSRALIPVVVYRVFAKDYVEPLGDTVFHYKPKYDLSNEFRMRFLTAD